MKRKNHQKPALKHRVITTLERREMDFLDKLGKDALFSGGHKLSYNEILRGLIAVAMEIGLSGENITSYKELKERILYLAQGKALERRRYPRLKKSLTVNFRPMESLAQYDSSITGNLSPEGLMLEMPPAENPPAINQLLEITISGHQGEPIRAMAKVVWIRQKEDGTGLSAGVRLTYIREEDKEKFKMSLEEEVNDEMKMEN